MKPGDRVNVLDWDGAQACRDIVLYKAFFVGFDPAKLGSIYVRKEDGMMCRAYYECVQYAEPPDGGWE